MFGRNKRDKGELIEARAIITNVQDTGTTINQNPRVKLTLQVQPEGREEFTITKKATVSRVRIPNVGDPIRVKYWENAPDGLVIQPRTQEDLAAAAGPTGMASPPAEDADPLDRLKKLNDLRQAGALTDAEFEDQKARILAEA
jgi:Short C-terminal domain